MATFVLTAQQRDELMGEISHACGQIQELAGQFCDSHGNADAVDALTAAISALASRSGWFADLARYGADGLLPDLDGALYWFIPDRCRPQRQSQTVEA